MKPGSLLLENHAELFLKILPSVSIVFGTSLALRGPDGRYIEYSFKPTQRLTLEFQHDQRDERNV